MAVHTPQSFLVEARIHCSYEAKGAVKGTRFADGTRLIGPYVQGVHVYTDRYRGVLEFEGREEIRQFSHPDQLLEGPLEWRREYRGGITHPRYRSDGAAAAIYEVLKTALRQFPVDKPQQRGPEHFRDGQYEYVCVCTGTFDNFANQEKILHRKLQVYAYQDRGGVVHKARSPAA